MNTIYDDLEIIKSRPGMFIGGKSVSYLETYLAGYAFAVREEIERLYTEGNIPFRFFHMFVADKYKKSSNLGWRQIILQEADGSEEKGLDLFFELLNEFKELKIVTVWSLDLSEECILYNLMDTGVPKTANGKLNLMPEDYYPMFSDVKNIYKVELSNGMILLVAQRKEKSALIEMTDSSKGTEIDYLMRRCFGKVFWKESEEGFEQLRLVLFENYFFKD